MPIPTSASTIANATALFETSHAHGGSYSGK